MEPFIAGHRRWPAGQRIWHQYAVPSLDTAANADLAELVREHHTSLSTPPLSAHVSAVPPQWLHATVRRLSLDPATVSGPDRQRYIQALQHALALVPAFTAQCTPKVNTWSTLLHLDDPGHGFEAMNEAVTQATRASLGDEALQHPPSPPHLTTSYCTKSTNPAPYEHATLSEPVGWTIDTVILANVLQDPVRHQYRWETVAEFSLLPKETM